MEESPPEVDATALVERLREERAALEEEQAAIVSELLSPGPAGAAPMGIDTPLVDPEGFPRADVDVYRARHARHRLACIKNDIAALNSQLEKAVAGAFRQPQDGAAEAPKPSAVAVEGLSPAAAIRAIMDAAGLDAGDPQESSEPLEVAAPSWYQPFARVDDVAEGGPAAAAGMRPGDEVLKVGPLSAAELRDAQTGRADLRPLAGVVGGSRGRRLPVLVCRNRARTLLYLVPNEWPGGRGLLGCHLVPFDGDWQGAAA